MTNVRVWFEKRGLLRFISHLDMNRLFLTALKKSGLPVWYTEGFNPHIYITFNTPLSLGFESNCESFDLWLTDDIPFDECTHRLNSQLPQGIRVFHMAYPVHRASDIAWAKYRVTLFADCSEALQTFLLQEEILAQKKTKKGSKDINLKEFIHSWEIGTQGKHTLLTLVVKAGNKENLNPLLLTNTFCENAGIKGLQVEVLREQIFVEAFEEFK